MPTLTRTLFTPNIVSLLLRLAHVGNCRLEAAGYGGKPFGKDGNRFSVGVQPDRIGLKRESSYSVQPQLLAIGLTLDRVSLFQRRLSRRQQCQLVVRRF